MYTGLFLVVKSKERYDILLADWTGSLVAVHSLNAGLTIVMPAGNNSSGFLFCVANFAKELKGDFIWAFS